MHRIIFVDKMDNLQSNNTLSWTSKIYLLVFYILFIILGGFIFLQYYGPYDKIIGDDELLNKYMKALLVLSGVIIGFSILGIFITIAVDNKLLIILTFISCLGSLIGIGVVLYLIKKEIGEDLGNKESNKLNGILLAVLVTFGLTILIGMLFIYNYTGDETPDTHNIDIVNQQDIPNEVDNYIKQITTQLDDTSFRYEDEERKKVLEKLIRFHNGLRLKDKRRRDELLILISKISRH